MCLRRPAGSLRIAAAATSALFLLLGALCGVGGFGPLPAGGHLAARTDAAGHGAPGQDAAPPPCGGSAFHAAAPVADADGAHGAEPDAHEVACHSHCDLYDQALKAQAPPLATPALHRLLDVSAALPASGMRRRLASADDPVPRSRPILHASLLL